MTELGTGGRTAEQTRGGCGQKGQDLAPSLLPSAPSSSFRGSKMERFGFRVSYESWSLCFC